MGTQVRHGSACKISAPYIAPFWSLSHTDAYDDSQLNDRCKFRKKTYVTTEAANFVSSIDSGFSRQFLPRVSVSSRTFPADSEATVRSGNSLSTSGIPRATRCFNSLCLLTSTDCFYGHTTDRRRHKTVLSFDS